MFCLANLPTKKAPRPFGPRGWKALHRDPSAQQQPQGKQPQSAITMTEHVTHLLLLYRPMADSSTPRCIVFRGWDTSRHGRRRQLPSSELAQCEVRSAECGQRPLPGTLPGGVHSFFHLLAPAGAGPFKPGMEIPGKQKNCPPDGPESHPLISLVTGSGWR